jgi:hypothetical protein
MFHFEGVIATANPNQSRNQFVGMIFIQICVTAFFSLQWLGMYMYWSFTQNNVKSTEKQTIDTFIFFLTNDLFYLNNVKSFFLSTLSSRRFRMIFITALLNLLSGGRYRQRMLNRADFSITEGTKHRRDQTLQRQF